MNHGFQIQTKPARNDLTSAEKMLEWRDSNKYEAKAVASHLIGNIQRCFSKKSKNPETHCGKIISNSVALMHTRAFGRKLSWTVSGVHDAWIF